MTTRTATGRKRRYVTAAAYLGVSSAASALFYLGARAKGASSTDAYLGIVWVFVLSAIVLASILPDFLQKRMRKATT